MWQIDDSTVDEFISASNGQFRHVCNNKVLLKLGERRMTFRNMEAFHASSRNYVAANSLSISS